MQLQLMSIILRSQQKSILKILWGKVREKFRLLSMTQKITSRFFEWNLNREVNFSALFRVLRCGLLNLNPYLSQLIHYYRPQTAGSIEDQDGIIGEVTGAIANAAAGLVT